jgi:spore germination cell wall hydrolase CwlJ-like protein
MRRIVPATLLALTAFVVLPTKTTPTTTLSHASVAVGSDGDTPGSDGKSVHPDNVDTKESGHIDKSDDRGWLVAASLTLDAIGGSEHQDGLRRLFELDLHDERQADPAPSDAWRDEAAPLWSSDGTTPAVAAPAAQGSTTAMSERTRNLDAAMTPPAMVVTRENELEPRQIYAGLIKPENMAREQRCLAEVVYFEARSEAEDGRAAIAQVVLNRVKSGVYPGSVCGVVYQNRHRKLACQFTFACEGKPLRVTESEPWEAAVRIAREVYAGKIYIVEVGDATHYHADYVLPTWAKKLKKMDVIGRHIFYS